METAIYNDLERRKGKARKKREVGILATEQSPERLSQPIEKPPAVYEEKEPIEREAVMVKVLRVCPNPRLLMCVHQDDGLERRVLVQVRKNKNFTARMELKVRPVMGTGPWIFEGKPPRRRGRW
jgi:hypothetical protein